MIARVIFSGRLERGKKKAEKEGFVLITVCFIKLRLKEHFSLSFERKILKL